MTALQLERHLDPTQLDLLRRASDSAVAHDVALYLVGGSVRDLLLGDRPADLDLHDHPVETDHRARYRLGQHREP